jgi:hypothetical protein
VEISCPVLLQATIIIRRTNFFVAASDHCVSSLAWKKRNNDIALSAANATVLQVLFSI